MSKQVALVIGKFYPPHIGHHHLIDTAARESDKVYVGVCWSRVETIDVKKRIEWLRDWHPESKVQFFPIHDDSPVNYTDETWGLFLDALIEGLSPEIYWDSRLGAPSVGGAWPNVIYSGEDYVPEFARRLTARYREVVSRMPLPKHVDFRKLDRNDMPGVSATEFRKNPAAHWDLLAPATRAGLCKRVVICGAESTGTTTLAKDLAEYFKTTVVPEYGRYFDWAVGRHHRWKPDDFRHIAAEQKRWEDNLARESQNGLLVCDTDEYATAMFSEVYLGYAGRVGTEIAGAARAHPGDLYIITDHRDVPFEDDGTRFNSGRREWMTNWFIQNLPARRIAKVNGNREQRLQVAVEWVKEALWWQLEDPIEKREGYEYAGMVQQ